jgi:hypothetical protein
LGPTAVDHHVSWGPGGGEGIAVSDPAGTVRVAVDDFTGAGRYTLTMTEG